MLFTIRTFGAILSALATSSLVNAAPTEAEILKIEAKGIPRTCIPQPGQITLMSEAAFPDQNTTATRVSCDPTSAKNGYIFSPNADGTFGSFNMKLSGDKASRHLQCGFLGKLEKGKTAMIVLPDKLTDIPPRKGVNGVSTFCIYA